MVLEAQPDLPHSHCDTCYCQYCGVPPKPHVSCAMVNCELDCGAKFHLCKRAEHKQLCSNEKVACISSIYGCPLSVLRCHMSKHLAVCPASVINCTMEWNRWPVCSAERQSHQPIQLSPDFNCEQLDIALALRDQRMLTKSMRASKRTRQILTNTLNRRHPAVPLSKQLMNGEQEGFDEQKELQNLLQSMHEWEQDSEKRRARTPPGLQTSICSELYKSKDSTGETLADKLKSYPKYPFIHCAHCDKRKARLERQGFNAVKDPEEHKESSDGEETQHKDGEAMDEECSQGATAAAAPPLSLEGAVADIDPTHMAYIDQYCNHTADTAEESDYLRLPHNSRSPLVSSSSEEDFQKPSLFVTSSTTGEVSAAPSRGHSNKTLIIQPPSKAAGKETLPQLAGGLSPTSGQPLSLDLSLESITRYQAKPDSMYTFLCAQEFRRDEFAYHFQNVHSDIHGGLNGWLEQRCPLAPYGCTFSQRRLYPGNNHGARIIHSEDLESFGLVLSEDDKGKSNRTKSPVRTYVPLLKTVSTTSPDTNNGNTTLHSMSTTQPMNSTDIHDMTQSDCNKTCGNTSSSDRPLAMDTTTTTSIQSNTLDNCSPAPLPLDNQSVPSPTRSNQLEEIDYLSELPLELLRYLSRFLDGFSMCNLAMTSKLLRQVCCSMLEERGMVILQWEKHRGHWQVAYKVWHFSSAFSPVLSWGFEDHPSMAMHLRNCPYNVKLQQTDPVRVMAQNAEPIGLRADPHERNLGWAFARQ